MRSVQRAVNVLVELGLVCSLGLGLVGCGQSQVDRFADSYESAIELYCTCWEAIGAESEDACIAEFPSSNRVCLRQVSRMYGSQIDAAMRCRADAAADLLLCTSRGDCSDSIESRCAGQFGMDVISCPAVENEAAAAALGRCL